MISKLYGNLVAPFLSLFTSLSTLICCALPVLLVSLGMGAVLASLITVCPWITVISIFKLEIFILAGLMLILSFGLFLRERNAPCPVDEKLGKLCLKLRKFNFIILIFSSIVYLVGFFFAFLASYVL